MTKRRIHEDEYMSSDIWKYNLDPPVYKRGSRHNKIEKVIGKKGITVMACITCTRTIP